MEEIRWGAVQAIANMNPANYTTSLHSLMQEQATTVGKYSAISMEDARLLLKPKDSWSYATRGHDQPVLQMSTYNAPNTTGLTLTQDLLEAEMPEVPMDCEVAVDTASHRSHPLKSVLKTGTPAFPKARQDMVGTASHQSCHRQTVSFKLLPEVTLFTPED